MAPRCRRTSTSPSSPPVLCVAPFCSGTAYASGRVGNWGSLRLSLFAHVQLAASSNTRHESRLAVGRQGFSGFFVVVTVVLLPDACKIGHGVDRNVVSSSASARSGPGLGLRLEGTKVDVDVQLSCLPVPVPKWLLGVAQALQDPE